MKPYPRYLDWLRYISAFLLFGYGSSKLAHMQFALNRALAHQPVQSLSGYELTWYYYGYSHVYATILGLTQIVGAALLCFRKTAVLGAIAMLPVMTNILLIDTLILPPDYGPTVPASIIFCSIVALIWRDLSPLLRVAWSDQQPEPPASRRAHFWIRTAIVTTIMALTIFGILTKPR